MSNHELTKIFYDGLGPQDRYLLYAASGGTFMSKYEDDAMELIEMVAKNSHHNMVKPFGRGAMPKMIDAKSVETGMIDVIPRPFVNGEGWVKRKEDEKERGGRGWKE